MNDNLACRDREKVYWRESMMKRLLCILSAFLLLAASSVSAGEPATGGENSLEIQSMNDNHRVFYEIFVGSFSDSNGDGIGDLRGIINRMDYLNDGNPASGKSLGIEGIWLTPIFLSPSYHKYDVTDYYQIDPVFGTMEDLQELISLCHERGVKLILDLVLNHTGRQNKWYLRFLEAHREGRTADRYYDYYTWYPDGGLPAAGQFMHESGEMAVEANFSDQMPELNYDNPLVRRSMLQIGQYYLKMGVDGFRFDAAKYLYLNDHEKNAAFFDWYISELKKINPDVYTVAEVWDSEGVLDRYTGSVNCFRFSASQAEGLLANTAKGGNVNRFAAETQRWLNELSKARPDAMNIYFISNHDTDRAAGFLTVASWRMQMAANLYILSPGSPFIYYGEEIGLRGSRGASDTDANRRLAMRWGDGDTVRDPEGSDYGSQTEDTVSGMLENENSLLNYYIRLLAIRREYPEIARGTFTALSFPDTKAGGFLCEWNGSVAGVFHNTTKSTVVLDLSAVSDKTFSEITFIGKTDASLEGTVLTLGPQTSAVLR